MKQISKNFNDSLHSLALSEDGSYTAYSEEYEEHYHSTRDGALKESLQKHVIPAFSVIEKEEVVILDICYGLGFNTLATLLHRDENFPNTKLKIYSPELDESLIKSLEFFEYPTIFDKYRTIVTSLSSEGVYEDENTYIELFLGDARKYIKGFQNKFDIVYQDAFSPSNNPTLWTCEYFKDIKNTMKKESVLTTYSISLKTRLALYENNFKLYLNTGEDFRDATIASFLSLENFLFVDMPHKIACNPNVTSLKD